jgi:hypothetical protein
MHGTESPRIGGIVSAPDPTALERPGSGPHHADGGVREFLHALAHRLAARFAPLRSHRPPPAAMSAARSEKDTTVSRGSLPGVPPAPAEPSSFPTAAGWRPLLPPEAQTAPVRLTASGVFRAVEDQRRVPERRFVDRRIRDDGSPYGVERRQGATRVGERRGAADGTPPPAPKPVSRVRVADVPHYPDLLAWFHGRQGG